MPELDAERRERLCVLDGCGKRSHARGRCQAHYWHLRQSPTFRPSLSPQENFWSKVDKTDQCWLWTGSVNRRGYGATTRIAGATLAHRISYLLLVGPIPEGMHLDHICHVPACVNPEHLRPVTNKQNTEHKQGLPSNNTSGVLGVNWSKWRQMWRVKVKHNGREHFGGYFADLAEAERAVVELRNRLFTHNDKDKACEACQRGEHTACPIFTCNCLHSDATGGNQ